MVHKTLRDHFERGTTRSLEWRENSLDRLIRSIQRHEAEIVLALDRDFKKPEFESFSTEIGFVLSEAEEARRELRGWSAPVGVRTPLKLKPGKSKIIFEPKGAVAILGPWNYPFMLALAPLVAAIAAGNTAAVKMSEFAPATAEIVRKIIVEVWPGGEVQVVLGDAQVASELLDRRWDHVFFTGGTGIGRKVAMACAKHLSPVTLELGGKSPCVIDRDVNLEVATRRIAWGKTINGGQTCVAPDYLLVHREIYDEFVDALKARLIEFFGESPLESSSLASQISERHFVRLEGILDGATRRGAKVLHGGTHDRSRLRFAPTVLQIDIQQDPSWFDQPIMKEEIFGPILPIMTWEQENEILEIVARNPRPLAFYVFSRRRALTDSLMSKIPFGGGCVNDVLMHIANGELPFGGIGESGTGAYHGRFGFETFSHRKSVVYRGFRFDIPLRYPPYTDLWKKVKPWLQ